MRKRRIIFIFLLIHFTLIMMPHELVHSQQGMMKVHFINVGQGDSILIQTPENKQILIDGGPPKSGKKVVQYLEEHDVDEIDLMIATHPDIDHIGGLKTILESFSVEKVMDIGKVHPTKTYMGYMYQLFKRKIPLLIAEEGENFDMFQSMDIRILNAYDSGENNNEASIVLQLSYGNVDFLLMGDVGKEEEKQLLDKYDPKADIIKIGHHGSKTSTSLSFLKAVQPETALLTYSKGNHYGHPVDRVVRNLHAVRSQIFSTAVYGDTVIETDGEKYITLTEKFPMDGLKQAE